MSIFFRPLLYKILTMSSQDHINFQRIAKAINYIQTHFKQQPNLDKVAESIYLSPSHFQKLFTDWAGTSPKKFLQFLSIEHAKSLLTEEKENLFNTTLETGLSSTSRLHDLFVNIEGMSPSEYKNGGKNLYIEYHFNETIFGNIIIASTQKGVCYMAFVEDIEQAFQNLIHKFPNAVFIKKSNNFHQSALSIFKQDWARPEQIKLHLKGTDFQLKVWESLLKIPFGKLSTYGRLAQQIGNPKASRAVGTAIGNNPIAFIIPCHRVIQSSGHFGGYMWGPARKQLIIGWESSKNNSLF